MSDHIESVAYKQSYLALALGRAYQREPNERNWKAFETQFRMAEHAWSKWLEGAFVKGMRHPWVGACLLFTAGRIHEAPLEGKAKAAKAPKTSQKEQGKK